MLAAGVRKFLHESNAIVSPRPPAVGHRVLVVGRTGGGGHHVGHRVLMVVVGVRAFMAASTAPGRTTDLQVRLRRWILARTCPKLISCVVFQSFSTTTGCILLSIYMVSLSKDTKKTREKQGFTLLPMYRLWKMEGEQESSTKRGYSGPSLRPFWCSVAVRRPLLILLSPVYRHLLVLCLPGLRLPLRSDNNKCLHIYSTTEKIFCTTKSRLFSISNKILSKNNELRQLRPTIRKALEFH